MIGFGVIYFIGLIIGCCVLWLHNNFDYTLTPLIISLNILIVAVIGREIYKKSKKDFSDCIIFSILNDFLLLCLIFSDCDSSIF